MGSSTDFLQSTVTYGAIELVGCEVQQVCCQCLQCGLFCRIDIAAPIFFESKQKKPAVVSVAGNQCSDTAAFSSVTEGYAFFV